MNFRTFRLKGFSAASAAAFLYLMPEAPVIVTLIVGFWKIVHGRIYILMNYIIAYFINYYEIYQTPAVTFRDEFTEHFWQNRFVRTENPEAQQRQPLILE